MVYFPLDGLDMTGYCVNQSKASSRGRFLYDLAAIVVHHGSGCVVMTKTLAPYLTVTVKGEGRRGRGRVIELIFFQILLW